MKRLKQEYNDTDWVGLYNFDKLSSLRVDELSSYLSHHNITFKRKKAEKVAMIKPHIGSRAVRINGVSTNLVLRDFFLAWGRPQAREKSLGAGLESLQPRQPPLRNVPQQVTSSLAEVETDSQK